MRLALIYLKNLFLGGGNREESQWLIANGKKIRLGLTEPYLFTIWYLLTALRVAAREAGEATVLVCHLLLAALWTLTL